MTASLPSSRARVEALRQIPPTAHFFQQPNPRPHSKAKYLMGSSYSRISMEVKESHERKESTSNLIQQIKKGDLIKVKIVSSSRVRNEAQQSRSLATTLMAMGGTGQDQTVLLIGSCFHLLPHPNTCGCIKIIQTEGVHLRESWFCKRVLSLQENLNAMKQNCQWPHPTNQVQKGLEELSQDSSRQTTDLSLQCAPSSSRSVIIVS